MDNIELLKKSMRLLTTSGCACARCGFEEFDVIGLSSASTILVKVVQNEMPRPWIIDQMNTLIVPPNCVKAVHIWHDGQDFPEVVQL